MHDTADLNKARQVLLVLPKLAATASVTSSARELFEKNTTEDALALSRGGPMPLGSELVLFNPLLSEATLGSDGTERTFGPPGGLDQRMWASGSFEFEQDRDLKIGQEVRCEVAVESVQPKQGTKTGLMVLVTRKLVYSSPEGVVMTERRCHVYRKQRPAEQRRYVPPSADAAPKAEEVEEKQSDFGFDYYATRAALFRYSAVTFNAHRIHLDPEYCRNEEGHPDCLVHGPLTATLLLNLIAAAADKASGKVQKFEYRATSPLTVEQRIRLRGAWEGSDRRKASLWALNEAGTVCMTAKATLF
ncbi:hypothetical protein PANT_22d00141 [Moesziomyces antarcticus T-34]|uniref:FAS1-like dehydratase domain-containing protein n=1 Tax=Pseudozyma antarctica (strain T-34) TaxID=1151754 RepID=M9MI61_PSEA3|nr:hypothetical protein PANT_22d00141 [Moesziomyces antarcticus T-34]